jgi:LacI family gluconate utilization system Gnt-I transcriptional repressor
VHKSSHVLAGPPVNRRGGAGPATLADVARLAGVSMITASRALSRPEMVRPPTLAKVTAAVLATGYVKNMLAGALASKRSKLVALVLPQIANTNFAGTVQAINETLALAGYQVLLGLSGYDATREELLVETILSRRPDGVILTGTLHTEHTVTRLRNAHIPVVETWDMTLDPIDMLVGFSHEQVGQRVAMHLLGRGYRRFGVLMADDPRGARRNEGLMAALARSGINSVPPEVTPAPATFKSGRTGAARLLDHHELDVIVCSSDTLAHGVLSEAASRGMSVPDDIAVMGFGDAPFSEDTYPALSTVRVDGAAIGTLAVNALLARIDGGAEGAAITDTGFELIHRAST